MIDAQCFTWEWIHQQRDQLRGADPTLLEKTILAFELLGQLAINDLSFVFKGGTCLLLLLDDFKRLSIDVDIVSEQGEQRLQAVFDRIIQTSPFNRWTEDPRTSSHIPKKHYKFFFDSQINRRVDYVLLDVLRSANLFPSVQKKPIDFPFIKIRKSVSVTIPTIDSLIGDKLTAFAPRTIGVPLEAERSMQIVKQLFDLGELFLQAANIEEISTSYNAFGQKESTYRQRDFDRVETLQDTFNACFLLSQLDLRRSIENETTDILRRGVRQINSHLIGVSFGLLQAKVAASKVAMLAALLLTDASVDIRELFYHESKIDDIRNARISGDRAILNRLKTVSPQAFHYWHSADRLLGNQARKE